MSFIFIGQLDILKTVELLKTQLNIKTLMVEGGSQVIQSFLDEKNSFSKLIITIAPKLVGNLGVSVSSRINSIEVNSFKV
jgi:2,5-diamino-6-(ribosylamino)-4(3H)-pyrimidinone 5'-phosphate reductase